MSVPTDSAFAAASANELSRDGSLPLAATPSQAKPASPDQTQSE